MLGRNVQELIKNLYADDTAIYTSDSDPKYCVNTRLEGDLIVE